MYRMMIVEDEALIRKGITRMIERLSEDFYVVKEACNAEEAILFLRENAVDVIISDIRMGDIDGVEMAGILSEKHPDILIVLLSGYSDFSYAKKAIENKVFSYLLKPLDEDQLYSLLENIRRELEHKRKLSGKKHLMELHVTGNISYLFWMVKQKELVFYMESGQEDKVTSIVNELFQYMEDNKLDLYVCKQLSLELVNLILNASNILMDAEKTDMIEAFCKEENLVEIRKITALKLWFIGRLMEVFQQFRNRNMSGKNHVIEEIKIYIEENYGSELSLTRVADLYGFNSFYLSNLFKICTGNNFLEFVNQTRIRKAIELLKTENMKIYKIASHVGYENVNNFTKLFKKYTGLTPGEYRKKLNEKAAVQKEGE